MKKINIEVISDFDCRTTTTPAILNLKTGEVILKKGIIHKECDKFKERYILTSYKENERNQIEKINIKNDYNDESKLIIPTSKIYIFI